MKETTCSTCARTLQGFERNKEQSLKIVKLLSALEAAGLMSGKTLPDYLYDAVHEVITELSKEILK